MVNEEARMARQELSKTDLWRPHTKDWLSSWPDKVPETAVPFFEYDLLPLYDHTAFNQDRPFRYTDGQDCVMPRSLDELWPLRLSPELTKHVVISALGSFAFTRSHNRGTCRIQACFGESFVAILRWQITSCACTQRQA